MHPHLRLRYQAALYRLRVDANIKYMWGRKGRTEPETAQATSAGTPAPHQPLKEAIRQVRIENAERTSVVVDLRDAEAARLELVNDALEPVFAEIPPEVDLFDRGISKGEVPRLWIDAIAYVVMGRDKRSYRFVQDTRFGRKILLESQNPQQIVEAVTRYIAGRLVERERALGDMADPRGSLVSRRKSHPLFAFVLGVLAGAGALIVAALLVARP